VKTAILTLIGITLLTSCQSEVEKIEETITNIQVANDSLWTHVDEYNRLAKMTQDSLDYDMGDDRQLLQSRLSVYYTDVEIVLKVISENQEDIKELREKQRKIQHGLN